MAMFKIVLLTYWWQRLIFYWSFIKDCKHAMPLELLKIANTTCVWNCNFILIRIWLPAEHIWTESRVPNFLGGIFGTVTVTSKESPMNKLSELEVCDFDWEIVIVFIEILTRKVVFMICTYFFMNEKNLNIEMHVILFKCNAKETRYDIVYIIYIYNIYNNI